VAIQLVAAIQEGFVIVKIDFKKNVEKNGSMLERRR